LWFSLIAPLSRRIDRSNAAVGNVNGAARVRSHCWIMSGDDKGLAGLLSQERDQLQHIFPVAPIQVACWFICDHEGGIGRQRNFLAL
jgi:hypothetical protein